MALRFGSSHKILVLLIQDVAVVFSVHEEGGRDLFFLQDIQELACMFEWTIIECDGDCSRGFAGRDDLGFPIAATLAQGLKRPFFEMAVWITDGVAAVVGFQGRVSTKDDRGGSTHDHRGEECRHSEQTKDGSHRKGYG